MVPTLRSSLPSTRDTALPHVSPLLVTVETIPRFQLDQKEAPIRGVSEIISSCQPDANQGWGNQPRRRRVLGGMVSRAPSRSSSSAAAGGPRHASVLPSSPPPRATRGYGDTRWALCGYQVLPCLPMEERQHGKLMSDLCLRYRAGRGEKKQLKKSYTAVRSGTARFDTTFQFQRLKNSRHMLLQQAGKEHTAQRGRQHRKQGGGSDLNLNRSTAHPSRGHCL